MSRSGAASIPDAAAGIIAPASPSFADLQAALNQGATFGLRVQAAGSITTSQTLQISSDCDLSRLSITYTGTGDAVQIGWPAVGQLTRLDVRLPQVTNGNYTNGAWPAGSRGVVIRNVFRSTFHIPLIHDFERGLVLVGDGSYGLGGCAYNKLFSASISNNLINEQLQLDNNNAPGQAFCNENKHVGGSWSHDGAAGHTNNTPVVGMRHITVSNVVGGSCNNNTWFGCSLESTQNFCEYIIECFGTDNQWIACRWEYDSNGAPPTYWRNGSARNFVFGGNSAENIVSTVEAGGAAPSIIGANASMFNTTSAGGVMFSNLTGGTTAAWSVMPNGWQGAGSNPATAYTLQARQGHLGAKATGDTSERWTLETLTARSMRLGSGIDTKNQLIAWGSGSPAGVTTANPGSLWFDYANNLRYSKATATDATGWHLEGFPPFTTAARPTAAAAGAGGHYFDTTLNKPGWSDGTTWRDATGVAI